MLPFRNIECGNIIKMDVVNDCNVLPGTVLIFRVTASCYSARRLLGVECSYSWILIPPTYPVVHLLELYHNTTAGYTKHGTE